MPNENHNSVSFIAGGAGFIAVNVIRRLLSEGRRVVVADNFSRGQQANLSEFKGDANLRVLTAELADRASCENALAEAAAWGSIDELWHLAANSDIPAGVADPDIDFKDTFKTTFELLRAMRRFKVPQMHFASSSAVYGDHGEASLSEKTAPLVPISNYGAMKLASEAQICAAAESHLSRANLFRFPNVVGVPATHGVIYDFIGKLRAAPNTLQVLGNGTQKKSYLHVSDLVSAMFTIRAAATPTKVEIINIGPIDDGVTVAWIAQRVVDRISPGATIVFGQGNKGWVGDVPRFRYSTERLQAHGWKPALSSAQAVQRAVDEIAVQFSGDAT